MWCPTDKTKHSSDSPRYIGSKFGFLFTCDHSFLGGRTYEYENKTPEKSSLRCHWAEKYDF